MAEQVAAIQPRKRKAPATPEESQYGLPFDINQQAFGRWLQGTIEISQEIAQFTQSRLQEDAAAWMQLAGCRSIDELIECQQRFAEKALRQYFDEATKLTQLIAGLTSASPPPTPQTSTAA